MEKMKADYEKARTIDDKDERLTYLNNLREGRKSMKDTENDQRTAAKEKYSEIMSKLTARPEL